MKSFAEMILAPTNPTDVLAKSVDDVVVEDLGEKVMLNVLVTNINVVVGIVI